MRLSPERGRPVGQGARELTSLKPYLVRYRYDADDDQVVILAVWHGARDTP